MRKALLVLGCVLLSSLLFAQTSTVTLKSAKFVSSVVVTNTTQTESVLLNGEMSALVQVLTPSSCATATGAQPCTAVPFRVLYSVAAIGVGQTTGKKYYAVGAALPQGTADLPGALVWNVNLYFLYPSPILPRTPVTLRAVADANAQGTVTAAFVPPAGLVSWWQAEDNARDVMGRNPGVLHGSVGFVPGRFGDAFTFSGQGFLDTAASATLQPQTLTTMAWVRHLGFPGAFNYVLSQGGQDCTAPSYALTTGQANLAFGIFDGTNFITSPDAGPVVWDGNWHLVAGTYDGHTIRLYLDGVEVGTGTPSTVTIDYLLTPSQQFTIGAYNGSCQLPFTGDIDEVRIFNRALNPAEIQSIYKLTP